MVGGPQHSAHARPARDERRRNPRFLASLLAGSRTFEGKTPVSAKLPRDASDTKFLALAAESHAAYLVTNDRRHLLPLKKFQHTKIVTPTQFLAVLA